MSYIYKATYSGVPVYEMLCKDASVMRRSLDSYINATHILKVAGFNKPMRTRLLEREVQLGEHEKVQGGYGKYQGTYIPLSRAADLARKYDVYELLQPLLEFTRREQSPPFTPKQSALAKQKKSTGAGRKQTRSRQTTPLQTEITEENKSSIAEELLENVLYGDGDMLDTNTMNMVVDKEGHGIVHWAAALGRLVTVQKLVELGADLQMASYKGETALMRSVLFTDNFDGKTFEALVDCLGATMGAVDNEARTVFHHAVLSCHHKGQLDAGRHYLLHLLKTTTDSQRVFNNKDACGETPLTLAARLGCRQIVGLLVDAGASTQIPHQSITAQMMIDVPGVLQPTDREPGLDRGCEPVTVEPLECALESRYTMLSERTRQAREAQDRLERLTAQLRIKQALLIRLPQPGPWLAKATQRHAAQTTRLTKLTMALQREKLNRWSGDCKNQSSYQSLVAQLKVLKDRRKRLVAEKLQLQSRVASCRLQDYKRLIGGCCGVEYDEVDGLLDGLVTVSSQPLDGWKE
ncbi:hypothetical protein CLU79DRAFT_767158 [Phycomyces nitens]|nr:hypothetical protein CLU79DRAFT_767158 [Phycomyces nitens]